MLLLVGLGNPGARYAYNRHNIGWMAVDDVAHHHRFGPWRNKFRSQIADGTLGGEKVLAAKPATFMNDSGHAVGEMVRFYKLGLDRVVVVHDDLDLAPGKCRVKRGGGAGGHNGLRSIDRHVGNDYWRIRLGIGHPGDKRLVHDYVLHDFAKSDEDWLDPLLEAVAEAAPLIAAGEPDRFMSKVALLTRSEPGEPA
jgi:PTH1 family peptidyl-tRNA hydrolase